MTLEQKAYVEEFLAASSFIAGALLFKAEFEVLGWVLISKGCWDTISAIILWAREAKSDRGRADK